MKSAKVADLANGQNVTTIDLLTCGTCMLFILMLVAMSRVSISKPKEIVLNDVSVQCSIEHKLASKFRVEVAISRPGNQSPSWHDLNSEQTTVDGVRITRQSAEDQLLLLFHLRGGDTGWPCELWVRLKLLGLDSSSEDRFSIVSDSFDLAIQEPLMPCKWVLAPSPFQQREADFHCPVFATATDGEAFTSEDARFNKGIMIEMSQPVGVFLSDANEVPVLSEGVVRYLSRTQTEGS